MSRSKLVCFAAASATALLCAVTWHVEHRVLIAGAKTVVFD